MPTVRNVLNVQGGTAKAVALLDFIADQRYGRGSVDILCWLTKGIICGRNFCVSVDELLKIGNIWMIIEKIRLHVVSSDLVMGRERGLIWS